MKYITVSAEKITLKKMYQMANTLPERALLGFILKAGLTEDPIFCNAFRILHSVHKCSGIYNLIPACDVITYGKILHVVELAMKGEWDDLAISRGECLYNLKRLSMYKYEF